MEIGKGTCSLQLNENYSKKQKAEKEKAENAAKSKSDSDEEPQTYLSYVSNLLHSLFSNCEVYFNKTMVYNAIVLYPHKAQKSNEINSSAVSNKEILACHGYSFEEYP